MLVGRWTLDEQIHSNNQQSTINNCFPPPIVIVIVIVIVIAHYLSSILQWIRCANPTCGKWRALPPYLTSAQVVGPTVQCWSTARNENDQGDTMVDTNDPTAPDNRSKQEIHQTSRQDQTPIPLVGGKWFCVLNYWDESLASCGAPQETRFLEVSAEVYNVNGPQGNYGQLQALQAQQQQQQQQQQQHYFQQQQYQQQQYFANQYQPQMAYQQQVMLQHQQQQMLAQQQSYNQRQNPNGRRRKPSARMRQDSSEEEGEEEGDFVYENTGYQPRRRVR